MKRTAAILTLLAVFGSALTGAPGAAPKETVHVVREPGTAAPSFVLGLNGPARTGTAAEAALAHIGANAARYHIARPATNLRVLDVSRAGADTTVRFGQVYGGIPVFGAQYLVHMRKTAAGYSARFVNGHFFTRLRIPTQARVGEALAARLAVARLRPTVVSRLVRHGLTILPTPSPVLVYHFTAWGKRFGRPAKQEAFVNALTGALTMSYNDLQYDGPITGIGTTVHGDEVPLELYQLGGTFDFRDETRRFGAQSSARITTHNAQGTPDYVATEDNLVTSPDSKVGTGPTEIGAVDAHWAAAKVFRYYKALGRNSIDNQGMDIVSTVNAAEPDGTPMINAFWDGSQMVFGNPPRESGVYPLSADLDVVGHELTHGVTDFSGGLVYLNQSGAMNEAYSDYFGEAIDATVSGTREADDRYGEVGEDLCVPGDPPDPAVWQCPLRDLNDGRSTDDHTFYLVDIDGGGVHLNSTIYAGALWNLRESIDPRRADAIVYKSLTDILTPLDDYVDGRRATVLAARALGFDESSAELPAVQKAFDDQGIVPGWNATGDNDAQILRGNVAPLGLLLSAPQVSGTRYILADYAKLTQHCCRAEQIFVGPVDGTGITRRVGEFTNPETFNDELPDISGDTAVWAHLNTSGDFDVHGRVLDPKLGKVLSVAGDDASWDWFPSIGGNLVAWERLNLKTGQTDIYARYLGTSKRITVSAAKGEQFFPQVYGDWVAYLNLAQEQSIAAKNLKTGQTMEIKVGPLAFLGPPGVGGGYIYWYQDSDFGGHSPDFRGGIKRIALGANQVQDVLAEDEQFSPFWSGFAFPPQPDANGAFVTFSDEFGYSGAPGIPREQVGRDVFIVEAAGGAPVPVTANRGDQAYPVIAEGRRVLWLDATLGHTDLMTKLVPTP